MYFEPGKGICVNVRVRCRLALMLAAIPVIAALQLWPG